MTKTVTDLAEAREAVVTALLSSVPGVLDAAWAKYDAAHLRSLSGGMERALVEMDEVCAPTCYEGCSCKRCKELRRRVLEAAAPFLIAPLQQEIELLVEYNQRMAKVMAKVIDDFRAHLVAVRREVLRECRLEYEASFDAERPGKPKHTEHFAAWNRREGV